MSGRRRLSGAAVVSALGIVALGLTAASASAVTLGAHGGKPAGSTEAYTFQTPEQASAQAARTGKGVQVTGATTPTSTLTANPNGTYTVTESAAPVRAKVGGSWHNLDAALVRNRNGSYSPAVSSQPLTLSGGGSGPLATMTYGGYSLALTAPIKVPAPEVAGNRATYRQVLPGVNLTAIAQPSGGFSEVLSIASAAAAANPALKTLTFTARSSGLTLKAGRDGAITAVARDGQTVFAAPAPRMWDSAIGSRLKTVTNRAGVRVNLATAQPAASTATSPGAGAHTARLGVTLAGDRIGLVPDRKLLTGAGAVYPEYIDPTWDSAGSAASSWAYVSSDFPSQEYYDTSSYLQMGINPGTGGTSYAFYTLPIPSRIYGAVIDSATAYFPEVWSYSCTASPVQLWRTGLISGSTTYASQPGWDNELGSDDVAYGWSSEDVIGGPSSCPASNKDVSYNITSTIATAAADSWPNLTVGLKAADTSDSYGWKQFADPDTATDGTGANATLTVTYANTPATPVLSTSPATNCASGILGNGNVGLNAAVFDKDGTATGSLTVAYTAYADGDTADTFATNPSMSVSAASGTTATLQLQAADLETAVTKYGSNDEVKITWTAAVSDGLSGVPSSPTASCTFTFSIAIPGAPVILDSAGNLGCDTLSYTVGTPARFTLEANSTSTAAAAPTSYIYQLNGGNSVTVPAGASAQYSATISITPTRRTNSLRVVATAAGGNQGQIASCVINAAAPGPAVDQDLTGDGIPDLLTVGTDTTGGTAPGLWLAAGQGNSSGQFDGTVDTTATDIAPLGPQDIGDPTSWNGMKAFTGEFTDSGFNDIEAYAPNSADVYVLPGQGDGSATTSDEQNLGNTLVDTNQVSGDTNYPLQLVNAYNVSGDDEQYPDQIGLFNDSDSSVGAYLAYFANSDGFDDFDASTNGLPYELTNTTPDGTMDWTDWTITTASNTPADASGTDMWLWDESTGALYLWQLTGLANETPGGEFNGSTGVTSNPSATLTCAVSGGSGTGTCGPATQTEVAADWNQGTPLATFQGTEIDGEPGVITVTSSAEVQSWAWSGTALTQANADQSLVTADHTYLLHDESSGTVATAHDHPVASDSANNLTGNSATCWNTGDLFSPDVIFNPAGSTTCGTSGGYLTSSNSDGDFAPNRSFTVSAWVDPAALGGTVFSQDGTDDSSVEVSSTTGGQWSVGTNTGSTTTGSYSTVSGGTADVGVWTDLTLTYNTSSGADILQLYANGVEIAYLRAAAPPAITGDFLLGARQADGAPANFFTGQMAEVQVWDDLAVPTQPASQPGVLVPVTPVRIMDTRSASKIGPVTGPVAANSTTLVPIDGNTTASLPASGITAVAVSITVTAQTAAGNLAVYPGATPLPATTAVNYATTGTTTNNAIVPVGPDGDIAITNESSGTAQLIVDLTGYFTTDTTATGASTYTPLAAPTRILDTRNGTGAPEAEIASGGTLTLTIAGDTTGRADLPSSGVTAVALNLTVVPTASGDTGFLTAYPDDATLPNTSNVSYDSTAGQPQAGTVIIPVGSDGKIDIHNSGDAINLVGDLSGYFTTSPKGQYYHPLDSTRIIDTRQTTALAASSGRAIADPGNILADNPTLVLNITVTDPADAGSLNAYPASATLPTASIVNFAAGETVPNLALVNTSDDNSFIIYNSSAGTVQVVVDTDGYFD